MVAGTQVKFVFNRACLREVQRQRETGDAMLDRGADIVNGAAGIAPRDTGAYISSLYASKEFTSRGWIGYANAQVPYAWFVEFGSDNWDYPDGFEPLRKAAEALGRVR